jgi:hypothetical protein
MSVSGYRDEVASKVTFLTGLDGDGPRIAIPLGHRQSPALPPARNAIPCQMLATAAKRGWRHVGGQLVTGSDPVSMW